MKKYFIQINEQAFVVELNDHAEAEALLKVWIGVYRKTYGHKVYCKKAVIYNPSIHDRYNPEVID